MINIPATYCNNPFTAKKFRELIEFMNQLEKDLEYPQCENEKDRTQVLAKAENELIMWGIL